MRALSLLCLLSLLLLCPACKRAPSRAERVYKQALEFKDADQTETALQYLRRAVELDPTFEDPYLDLASIYESAGDYHNAIEWYQKYLQVTKDPRMKQLAQNWLADVRALAAEQSAAQPGAPAKPASAAPAAQPAAPRELVSEALAKEREQLQREFSAREKALAQQHQRALDDLKDELRKLKTANTELQDKLEELTQERNSLADRLKKAGNLKDIADVFANPSYAPTDRERELTQMLADARKEADTWRASVQNLERTAQQNAEQLVRLRQQLAEAQRGINLAATGDSAAASAQLAALRKENAELKQKLDALQSSAGATAAAQSAARAGLSDLSEEITKMQQTIEYQKTLLARRDAKIAQLEAAGARAAAPTSSSDKNLKELIDELNRQLLEKDRQIAALQSAARSSQPAASPDLAAELQRKDQLLREYAARIQQLERAHYAYTDTSRPSSYPPPTTSTTPTTPATSPSGTPLYQPIGYNDSYRSSAASPTTYSQPAPAPPRAPLYTPPASPRPTTPTRPPRAYRVRRGDTLASIAQQVYGDRNKWNIIFAANRDILRRADYLREGQILYIPPQ